MPELLDNVNDRRADARKRRERRAARRTPARRARRRVVLKVVAVILVLALFLVLALLVGDGDYRATAVGWVPFLAAVFAIILAFVYLQVLKATLEFSDAAAERECERGRDIRFDVHFANQSFLFFFKVEAFFFISDLYGNIASEASTTLGLAPHAELDLSFHSTFEHIGTYSAGLDRVVISDFLGLFTATKRNETRREVRVLPQMQVINTVCFSNDAIIETTKAARSVLADSMDYAYVRDYELGDPLRAIHWKLSARADRYVTRLYEIQTNPGVAIIMDFYAAGEDAETLMGMFDAVVESAFSLAEYAREQGMDTEVLFHGQDMQTHRVLNWSREERIRIIGDMPRMSADPSEEAASIAILRDEVTSPTGQSNIVMCSASMDPTMLSSLADAKLRRRAPLLVSVVPRNVIERDRDAYCKPLARLDDANIPYIVLSDSQDLSGVSV